MGNDDYTSWTERRLGACDDDELVRRVRAALCDGRRDKAGAAFAHLHQRHGRRVTAMAMAKLPTDRVEDLVQDVFTDAFRGIADGARIGSFRAWIAAVAGNKIADFHRGREGRQLELDRAAAARASANPDAPDPEPATDGGYGSIEVREALHAVLAKRSDKHRRVIELNVLEGRPAAEVGAETGEGAQNVYKIAERFRTDLRGELGDPCPPNRYPGTGREDGPGKR